jgi:O-6-methylguanine DNA methyltransferase
MVKPSYAGELLLAREPRILITIHCTNNQVDTVDLTLAEAFSCAILNASPKLQEKLITWLKKYARKESCRPPLDLKTETFSEKVLGQLVRIPLGQVKSYQEIAKLLGNPKASRAVGNACGSNPLPLFIPCHRVVASDGSLGGFSCGLEIKKRLLAFES